MYCHETVSDEKFTLSAKNISKHLNSPNRRQETTEYYFQRPEKKVMVHLEFYTLLSYH